MKVIERIPFFEAEMFHSKGHIPKGVYEKITQLSEDQKTSEFRLDEFEGGHLNDGDWVLTAESGIKFICRKEDFWKIYQKMPYEEE
jgi:hypothetical protein